MPWLAATHVVPVPDGASPAHAYCDAAEQACEPTPDAAVASLLDAYTACTKTRTRDAGADAGGLCEGLHAAHGRHADTWARIAELPTNAYPALVPQLLPYAHDPAVPLEPMLHALTVLLHTTPPPEVWDTSDTTRLPVPVLTSVLEHPAIDTVAETGLYPFFAVYLDSVHAFLLQAYDHALKRLMHYLLEHRQQPHEPTGVRMRYRMLGTLLLERRVVQAFDATLAPHALPAARVRGDSSLCVVLDLYAPHLLAAGAAHARLLRLIGLALAHDALKAANSCLALPDVARSIHTARKQALHTKLDAHTDERVYAPLCAEYRGAVHNPSIAANLWHECALALCSDVAQSGMLGRYFVRATSLAALFFPAPVAQSLALRRVANQGAAPSFDALSETILAATVQTRHAMATIAEQFGVASTNGARTAWDAVLHRAVDALPFLYASEAPAIRNGAAPATDVDLGMHFTRYETLHGQFLENASVAANGADRFLRTYTLVAQHVPSAFEGAPTFLAVLDDLLHVFCDHHLGLFLPFVAWHPASTAVAPVGARAMPPCLALWERASEALACIFARVPEWSRSAAREALLAWLPRVPALASFMVKRVSVVVAALGAHGDPSWTATDALASLAVPLDRAIGWLRLNHKELLQELSDYIRRVVQTFSKAETALPQNVTQHAVDFLTQQLDIPHANERKTLLSTAQLELLLDELLALPKATRTIPAPLPAPAPTHTPTPLPSAKLRQQTLSFAPAPPAAASPSPRPHPEVVDLTGEAPRNAFRAASASKPATRPAPRVPPRSGPPSRLSQLRSEFQQSRNVARRPHAPIRALEPDEPRAPLAVSTVAPAVNATAPPPRKAPEPDTDTDSSSSDEGASGLGALASPRKAPKPVLPPPRRSVVLLEDSALQHTMRKARDDGRMRRLRAPPDYSELHRCILAWDMDTEGDAPPNESPVLSHAAQPVPPTFPDSETYMRIYGALFLKECWAQFQQAKEELAAHDLLPVSLSVSGSVNELVRLDCQMQQVPAKWALTDADVVCLKSQTIRLLAKVESVEHRTQTLRVALLCHPTTPTQRTAVQGAGGREHAWRLGKLFSLVTLRREFAALLSVPDLGLVDDVLRARAARRADVSEADTAAAMRRFGVNMPQARAILGAMRTPGFSLIQGPPGTGKTKTISALVATFLQRRRNGRLDAKMLLCAPSNAAIDEIVARIQHGVQVDGRMLEPRMVRVGREDAVNPAVRHTTLEAAVERRKGLRSDATQKQQTARRRLQEVERLWQLKEQELTRAANPAEARQRQAELNVLTDQRLEAREEHDSLARAEKSSSSVDDARRHHIRVDLLAEAEIVCTTLAGAGHELLYPLTFDTVVIDEAVQAVELSTLIPLRYNCTRCIMVGDPKQLPPTVISQEAEKLGYAQSLFVRMYAQAPEHVYLLSIQYRMHPHISLFPSSTFYGGQLTDGDGMAQNTAQPWHAIPLFGPFRVLDMGPTREETGRAHSLVNRAEAEAALALYDALRTYARTSLVGRVGFITMYKAQVTLMRSLFRARYGAEALDDATFNTVDGFQGQEKDVVILSCVRSNSRNAIGFLGDQRRLNVALTRARSNMFVLGDAAMLQRASPAWERLITEASARGYLIQVTTSTFRTPTRVQASVDTHHKRRTHPTNPDAVANGTPNAASVGDTPPPPPPKQRKATQPPFPRAPLSPPRPTPRPTPRPSAAPKQTMDLLGTPARHTPATARPPTVQAAARPPAARPLESLPVKPDTRPTSLPSKPSIPPPGHAPPKTGKWAAIVARSKEKPTAPRPTPITPGESRPRPPSRRESGPSWLRPARPSGK